MPTQLAKKRLQELINKAKKNNPNVIQFIDNLNNLGVSSIPNIATTGRMNGFRFAIDDISFMASHLGKEYAWTKLSKEVVYEPEKHKDALLKLRKNSFNKKQKKAINNHIKHRSIKNKIYYIYALMAQSHDGERKACYIGQTVNPKRRFREHFKQRENKGSYDLFQWANKEKTQIYAAILFKINTNNFHANQLESYFLNLALEANFSAPGLDRWGNWPLPKNIDNLPSYWPLCELAEISLPLSIIVDSRQLPKELFDVSDKELNIIEQTKIDIYDEIADLLIPHIQTRANPDGLTGSVIAAVKQLLDFYTKHNGHEQNQ